ncbi:hypothetical protein DNH61_17850 [Paenibacillus sambharensis]|uniref:DUF1802 domain-containing protein n=1 Tax=Paenibacillus sambharensis TaxID=1803190 RepID=A0A2W1L2R3_9BACL|nr:DUF1802 family protein [Paenibacillus sambharensis]PZD94278.1 hypothetical protein DNH61_17850 [Paenibacillus sambharensis]
MLVTSGSDGSEQVALKEWASAVQALKEGKLIMIMRKGGIAEETRDFRLVSPRFFLLPAYEHQRRELLKPEYQELVDQTLGEWSSGQDFLRIDTYAEAVDDIEVTDQEQLDKLRDLHIWTDTFAEERLKWKRKQPLHVLLLRVFRLEQPVEVPLRPAYTGCKSWVKLEEDIAEAAMKPVLTDEQFHEEMVNIRKRFD